MPKTKTDGSLLSDIKTDAPLLKESIDDKQVCINISLPCHALAALPRARCPAPRMRMRVLLILLLRLLRCSRRAQTTNM
jgi:hypothetical protein